ncbi:MAG: hypothetical protein AAGD14_18405, partial [Planctomycetota bacterium]
MRARFLLPALLAIAAACNRSDSAAPAANPPPVLPQTAEMEVVVRDDRGFLVSGADVNVDGVTEGEVTDVEGRCLLDVPTGGRIFVRVRKDGFVDQVAPVDVATDVSGSEFGVTLIARGEKLVLADGGSVEGASGAKVTVPANAFVDRDGNPVTGAVDAFLTPVDVSDDDAKRAFPGRFEGIAENGDETLIL